MHSLLDSTDSRATNSDFENPNPARQSISKEYVPFSVRVVIARDILCMDMVGLENVMPYIYVERVMLRSQSPSSIKFWRNCPRDEDAGCVCE